MDPAHSQLSITANRTPTVLEREQDKPHFSHPTALKSSLGRWATRSRAQKWHSQQQGALGSQPPGDGVGQPTSSGVDRDVGCPLMVNYDPMVEMLTEKKENLTLHMIKYSSNYIIIYIHTHIHIYTYIFFQILFHYLSLLLLFSCVRLFATPWTVARQASLSFTISHSLLKLRSIESVMPSNHLILCHPLLSCSQSFPHQNPFQCVGSSHQVAKVLELFHYKLFQDIEYSFLCYTVGPC